MKTDFYTKTLLTIISACLLSIVLRDAPIVSTAHAQEQRGPVDVNIAAVGGTRVNGILVGIDGLLPVRVVDARR